MSFDRSEQAGLGIAAAGHVLLFAILSAGFLSTKTPLRIDRESLEVQLVDEIGLESGAPEISEEAPAPKLAEVEAPIEPAPPEPAPPQPAPVPKPVPAPKPTQIAKPAPKEAPPKKKLAQQGGRLAGILEGLSDRDTPSRSKAPPARTISAAAQASLASAVRRQLQPHWSAPTGADADQLRTELSISLARDGSIRQIKVLRQTGITASNRGLAELHKERAIRAAKLAAPFQLPLEYYDSWKVLEPIGFDARL